MNASGSSHTERKNILTSRRQKLKSCADTSNHSIAMEAVCHSKGKIDIDELEEPLIAFGLCETREEVINLVKQVDLDGNGTIEFDEFLLILKNAGKVYAYIGKIKQNTLLL
jgi:Ca2+-binding EF-hand superfamily protein